jgi:hypothetical protein
MKEGYIPKEQRKKILFICDDIRMHSGVATMAREIVLGTSHHYNWVVIGAAINHPEAGQRMDLSEATNTETGNTDSNVILYPKAILPGFAGSVDKISLFIALAPAILFQYSSEPTYKYLAKQKLL